MTVKQSKPKPVPNPRSTYPLRPFPNGDMPVIAIAMPVMYEDDGQEEMGDSEIPAASPAFLRTPLHH